MIQSMNQRFRAAFKACDLRKTIAQVIAAIETNNEKTLKQFWKDYNLYDCIEKLSWVWGDIIKECINDISKNTLKRS